MAEGRRCARVCGSAEGWWTGKLMWVPSELCELGTIETDEAEAAAETEIFARELDPEPETEPGTEIAPEL